MAEVGTSRKAGLVSVGVGHKGPMLDCRGMARKRPTRQPKRRPKRLRARLVRPREPDKAGPDTARLVIDGDFEGAVRKALRKRAS